VIPNDKKVSWPPNSPGKRLNKRQAEREREREKQEKMEKELSQRKRERDRESRCGLLNGVRMVMSENSVINREF